MSGVHLHWLDLPVLFALRISLRFFFFFSPRLSVSSLNKIVCAGWLRVETYELALRKAGPEAAGKPKILRPTYKIQHDK